MLHQWLRTESRAMEHNLRAVRKVWSARAPERGGGTTDQRRWTPLVGADRCDRGRRLLGVSEMTEGNEGNQGRSVRRSPMRDPYSLAGEDRRATGISRPWVSARDRRSACIGIRPTFAKGHAGHGYGFIFRVPTGDPRAARDGPAPQPVEDLRERRHLHLGGRLAVQADRVGAIQRRQALTLPGQPFGNRSVAEQGPLQSDGEPVFRGRIIE